MFNIAHSFLALTNEDEWKKFPSLSKENFCRSLGKKIVPAPMTVCSLWILEEGCAQREQTLLEQTFLRYYGNPRLDIKQTLTAAGNHSSPLFPRYPLPLSRTLPNGRIKIRGLFCELLSRHFSIL